MQDTNVGVLPVTDERDVLIGVVTDRDLALRVCAQGGSASDANVGDILSEAAVSCRPEDDLSRAEELMVQEQVSRVIVTDAEGHVQGVISLSDVALADTARAAGVLRQVASREVLDKEGAIRPEIP